MEIFQESRPLVYVVAGVVLNEAGDYLLASRPEGKPYAGYWEFVGGKVEPGEDEFDALKREFEEELGIDIHRATPWLTKIHNYEHARVHLRFFRVGEKDWSGSLQAKEGQQWSWQKAGDFNVSPMLPANGSLLAALAIPSELKGNLRCGFVGATRSGEYRVVPFSMMDLNDSACLISESELHCNGKRPQAESVWVVVERVDKLACLPEADVLVWPVSDDLAAEQVLQVLSEGVAVPLVVLASAGLSEKYRYTWLAAGVHAVVADDEIK